MCHMSCVACHIFPFFLEKVFELVGGGFVIHGSGPSSFKIVSGNKKFVQNQLRKDKKKKKIGLKPKHACIISLTWMEKHI